MRLLPVLAACLFATVPLSAIGFVGVPPVTTATIIRDSYGVPHIFADSEDALFYANGYAQAQDRLFAMDVVRHVSYGNAATFLGAGQLGSDISVRRELYSRLQLADQLLGADPVLRANVDAFALGVNHAAAEMFATGNPPAEFVALNHAPEPWTALDTVAVAVFLLDRFGTGGGGELGNAATLAQLQGALPAAEAEAAFNDYIWGVNDDAYPTIPADEGAFAGPVLLPKALSAIPAEQAALLAPAAAAVPFGVPDLPADQPAPFFDPSTIKWGSNALLVAPSLSRSGQALVGGGPQTGYFNPQILYEVGLHGGGVDAVGVGVIGAPGIVLGRTGTFAWTVTSGISDQTDVVGLPAAGPRSYAWDDEERLLDCRVEVHVAVQPPALAATGTPEAPQVVEQEVCDSGEGPIMAITYDADGVTPTYFWASRKAHRDLEAFGAAKWLNLDRAQDLDDFRAAFDDFPFTFNFNYAGPEGACYHHVGTHPIRNAALDPRLPTPAGDAFAWSGFITGADMPRLCNPDQGYFANWNNLPQRDWPSGDSAELWGTLHRVERLDREVQQAVTASPDAKLDLAQVKEILRNTATEDSLAFEIVPELVQLPILQVIAPGARQALLDWAAADYPWTDANSDDLYDHPGHTVYDQVLVELHERVLADELGPRRSVPDFEASFASDPHAGDHGQHGNKFALLVDALEGDTAHDWCDDATTDSTVETCDEQLLASLYATGLAFYDTAAEVPLTPEHMSPFTAIGAGPAFEMPMTNRATYYHFHVGTDTGQSVSAIAPGQSGHLTLEELATGGVPEHMGDQLPLYVNFAFKVVPVTRAEADAVADTTQVLTIPDLP